MNKEIKEILNQELKKVKRSLVATPETRENLDAFAKANNGSNDPLLTQLAVNYGYKIALQNTLYSIETLELETKNKKQNG